MRKLLRIVLVLVIAITPVVLLSLYTITTLKSEAAKTSVNVSNLKLITPVAIIDEITKDLEEENLEEANLKINNELPDPNIPSSKGTPLVVLAAEKGYIDIVAALIQKGADPNKTDLNTSETALIKAVRNNDYEMVKEVLLPYGANPNLGTNQGITPLGLAIDLRNKDLANLIISSGGTNGISSEKLLLYAFKKNPVGVDLMLSGGIQPDITDKDNNTPLIIAAANGDLESVKELVAYRANINAKNKVGMTPLLYAVKGRYNDVAEYLINSGAKINSSNVYGQNAIFWAAYNGENKLVHNLLMLGANYEKKTRLGQTPLQIAKALGYTETAKMIEDFIAYKNLPRDSKGNIILPQVNKEKAQQIGSTSASGIPAVDGSSEIGAGIMADIDKVQAEQSTQKTTPQAAEEQKTQAEKTEPVGTKQQEQTKKPSNKVPQKTQINKLNNSDTLKQQTQTNNSQTTNSMPEMPQMPGSMDMSAIMNMMGGAQGAKGAQNGKAPDMAAMMKQMQNMGGAQGGQAAGGMDMSAMMKQMQNMGGAQGGQAAGGMDMSAIMSMMGGAQNGQMPDVSKMMPAGTQLPAGMDANSIMSMSPAQLKQMGIPDDQIAQITQAKQQMGQAQNLMGQNK